MLAVCVHAPSQKGTAGICRRTQLPPNKKAAWEKDTSGNSGGPLQFSRTEGYAHNLDSWLKQQIINSLRYHHVKGLEHKV